MTVLLLLIKYGSPQPQMVKIKRRRLDFLQWITSTRQPWPQTCLITPGSAVCLAYATLTSNYGLLKIDKKSPKSIYPPHSFWKMYDFGAFVMMRRSTAPLNDKKWQQNWKKVPWWCDKIQTGSAETWVGKSEFANRRLITYLNQLCLSVLLNQLQTELEYTRHTVAEKW